MRVRREINLYFSAMTLWEALLLLAGGLKTLLAGNRGLGRWASDLEAAWTSRFGGEEAVVFPSARAGLYTLLRALDVGPGDEVIITGFTCNAVPVPVLQCGAVPVYADIDPLTYNSHLQHIEALIGPRTKVLIIQHTFGIPADVSEMVALARDRGLYVIEDVCLALGSRLDDKPLGTFGDAALFSFELSKTLSAGWGGIVQANLAGLGERLRRLRGKAGLLSRLEAVRRLWQAGLCYFLYHPRLFWVCKYVLAALFKWRVFRYSTSAEERQGRFPPTALKFPADSQWRIIAQQLDRLDAIMDQSARVARRYREILRSHGWQLGILGSEDSTLRLIRFPLLVEDRDRMTRLFLLKGVELGSWFDRSVAPMPQDSATFNYFAGQCPTGEEVSRHIVNLPLHPRLSRADVDQICQLLDKYLAEHPKELKYVAQYSSEQAKP